MVEEMPTECEAYDIDIPASAHFDFEGEHQF